MMGQSYVATVPRDLNGDGRIDFLLNKFEGQATALRAETTVYLTNAKGEIPRKGLKLKPEGNRAAGALAVDLNQDGKEDLVTASAQFNVWSVVRALLKRQAQVTFAFYLHHARGYRLNQPDFTREISFRFDLNNLEIDGVLPTLNGDFNGDGFPDAIYARNRRTLTVLIQHPKEKKSFSAVPSGTYDVSVPRAFTVGDLNGDKKSDVVLFEKRAAGNRKVSVLLNSGVLK